MTDQEQESQEEFRVEEIFKDIDMEKIYSSPSPISHVFELLESYFRKKSGIIEYDYNLLMATSEFHVNNYIFLKEKFDFKDEINAKVLNILALLLNLKDPDYKSNQASSIEINYTLLSKKKISELKQGLLNEKLIPYEKRGSMSQLSQNSFKMKLSDVNNLLEYVNSFYLSFFKLYYHFINIERITENKKISIIINKPNPIPALSNALRQIEEKPESNELNEEMKDKKQSTYLKKEEEHVVKEEEKIEEKHEKQITTEDLLQKYKFNKETESIIREKIVDLKKEIDYKVVDRQKKLDEKVKEVEDIIKGKKK